MSNPPVKLYYVNITGLNRFELLFRIWTKYTIVPEGWNAVQAKQALKEGNIVQLNDCFIGVDFKGRNGHSNMIDPIPHDSHYGHGSLQKIVHQYRKDWNIY